MWTETKKTEITFFRRLNPKYLTENWLRRHYSVPFDQSVSGTIDGSSSSGPLPGPAAISVIMIPEQPPQYSEHLGALDTPIGDSNTAMEDQSHFDYPPRNYGSLTESSIPQGPQRHEEPRQHSSRAMTMTRAVYGRPRTSHHFPTSTR